MAWETKIISRFRNSIQAFNPAYIIVLFLFLFYFFTTKTQSQKLLQQLIGDSENDMRDKNDIQVQKLDPGELALGGVMIILFLFLLYLLTTKTQS